MNFGQAIAALKEGKKVTRKGWNGKNMFLWLKPATRIKSEWCKDPMLKTLADNNGGEIDALGTICMFTAQKQILSGWLASQTDLLSEDWEILDDSDCAMEVDNRPITERVKTFDDALNILGENNPLVKTYYAIDEAGLAQETTDNDVWAYLKLRIIAAALNEGWEPQFTEDECRYYPWFYLYTQEEIDEMSDERKEELGLLLWGGSANYGSLCGLACANSGGAWSVSAAGISALALL